MLHCDAGGVFRRDDILDEARRAMLTVFEELGPDSDLARQYRRLLAAAVNR